MDGVSINADRLGDEDGYELEMEEACAMTEYVSHGGIIQGENPLPPRVGMEFDSYEDVYYFYNCYAREQGFGVRVSNTWYRKSKERYRAKLSCSSAGFKKKSEANRPRPETRTGCPAMIKFRLIDSAKRWRVVEAELEHNHLISPASVKLYKSHKRPAPEEDSQKIRLFRTVIVDSEPHGSANVDNEEEEEKEDEERCEGLALGAGDSEAVRDFLLRSQLSDPNFFYVADLSDKGRLRSLFWAESRARGAYSHFGDVVSIETACLAKRYEAPLVSFVGVNHHGQSVLLGCGLLSGETVESYTWLFRAWLTCLSGRPPRVVITEQCSELQLAVADVFPRVSHCLCLSRIMQKVPEQLGGLFRYDAITSDLDHAVYTSLRPEEFESAWEAMIERHGLGDQAWLRALYELRRRWAPVYLKDVFLAGMFPIQPNEVVPSFFDNLLEKDTSLKVFFSENYEQALRKRYRLEAAADSESKNSTPAFKTGCYFESQLSKAFTNEVQRRFESEVVGMYSCFNSGPTNENTAGEGPIRNYIVKEQIDERETRDFEVLYNPVENEVLCVCGVFNFRGYLCRHALSVLAQNGVLEVPQQYVLCRWRKDVDRSYVLDHGFNSAIDMDNPIHRYDRLYKCIVRVVEEGRKSRGRHEVAAQGLGEILDRLRLAEDIAMTV